MKITRTILTTLKSLSVHTFRSLLAATGVVLGIAAVLSMTAISEGARRKALDQIREMGINNIMVQSLQPAPGGGSSNSKQQTFILEYGLMKDDVEHICNVFENVKLAVPVRDMLQNCSVAGKETDVHIVATTPEFSEVTESSLKDSRSRFLTWLDERELSPVCVVGKTAAVTLFGFKDPLGQTISCGQFAFKVVGILDNPSGGRLAGQYDLNNMVYLPLASANAMFGDVLMRVGAGFRRELKKVAVDYLYISVKDTANIKNTAGRLRAYLSKTHGQGDYKVQVPYELLVQEENTQRIFAIVMGSIAAISLLVGGIGIMNIMLANVYERMQEIGTRRALGARKRDILFQFLAESIVLTVCGGVVGLMLGAGIAGAVHLYAALPAVITLPSVVVSLSVAVLTGVIFGTYPAWKAANLDPIATLRR